MAGYLDQPGTTAEVMRDGWYVTGDIAMIDEDGFIFITDRLSRFSKIGGEMVPHVKIEEAINDVLGESCSAVTAVPDRRARRTAGRVLHARRRHAEALWEQLCQTELPRLWLPRRENIHYHRGDPDARHGQSRSPAPASARARASRRLGVAAIENAGPHVHADSCRAAHRALDVVPPAPTAGRRPRSTAERREPAPAGRRNAAWSAAAQCRATRRSRAVRRDSPAAPAPAAAHHDGAAPTIARPAVPVARPVTLIAAPAPSRTVAAGPRRLCPSPRRNRVSLRGRLGGRRRHELAEQARRARLRHRRCAARRVLDDAARSGGPRRDRLRDQRGDAGNGRRAGTASRHTATTRTA